MTKLLAYHNNPAVKADLVGRMKWHQAQDRIVQGLYWNGHKGCLVGCAIHDDDHSRFEPEFGIEMGIAFMADRIFERLPKEDAIGLPLAFAEAIPVGADLGLVIPRLMHFLLTSPEIGILRIAREKDRPSIEAVASLYARKIAGDDPTEEEWSDAARAARAARAALAAYAYAYAAAYAADADAAYAAAWKAIKGEFLSILASSSVEIDAP